MSTGSTPTRRPSITPTADHIALAKRCARRYSAAGLDPEDLEQEAQLALLEALAQHGDAPDRLAVSIRSHLSRVVVSELRRADPLYPLVGEPIDPRTQAGVPDLLPHEWTHALEQLSLQQRLVISLTRDGHDDASIAHQLETTPATVQTARCSAIARLREFFGTSL